MIDRDVPIIQDTAVIGAGYWGKKLVRVFYELGRLKTVCDADTELLGLLEKKYEGLDVTSHFEAVLADTHIKAVVIATPACSHFSMAREVLLAGKDVYVEKPLALKVRDGRELVDLASQHQRILMVGHILQYHPAIIKLQELIKSGYLGKIRYIYSNRLNIGKLRTEENILWSFAPHDISVILSLVGEEPESVYAEGEAYLQHDIHDVTLTVLQFSSGIKAHIFVSWLHPFKEQRLVVVGSERMVVFDDTNPEEKLVSYPHTIKWKEGKIPVAEKAHKETIPIEEKEPLKAECEHFLSCVDQRKTPKTNGHEGLRVLKVLDIAQGFLAPETGEERKSSQVPHDGYFVHPTSIVEETARIGKGTKIWHFSHILDNTSIGEDCVLGQNVMVGPHVTIGNGCKIQNNVSIYKGVTLENNVFCGPSCVFTNVHNPRAFIERKHEFRPTLVKRGATIGANATILCGHSIGEYALVGAGAVVTQDVPSYAIVVGVPARQKGWVCKCGNRLNPGDEKGHSICVHCKSRYEYEDGLLRFSGIFEEG